MVSLTNFRSVNELNTSYPDDLDQQTDRQHLTSFANSRQQQQLDQQNQFQQQQTARASQRKYNLNNHPVLDSKLQQQLKGGPLTGPKSEHFEIRWNNLTYQVEPKWYRQKWLGLTSGSSSSGNQATGASANATGSSANVGGRQQPSSGANNGSGGKTNILNNLNGSVKSGQVTAILGPSGAGKTSLLGCLTGKNKSGVSGSVQIISNRQEPMSICTIPQKDYLLNQLTVRENLWFASRLKHPKENFDHESNIERVLDLLKLESCIDTKISKISGGQYKRVSIAQELLSNPDILILDEPTSGLDSLTCYKTVMVLRDLARLSPNPMAIIVTIHQPQREVFDLFNHVYILAVGGRCIYEGHPSQSIKTINECSGGLHFDADQYNPASYLVEIASVEFGQKPIEALVEHQARDFKRRVALNDSQLVLQPAGTPGLKKRQSPMVARFKSTLSSLTGQSNSQLQQQQRLNSQLTACNAGSQQQTGVGLQHQHQLYAYTNEAYDTSQVGGGGGDHQLQPPPSPPTLAQSEQHPRLPAPAYSELDPGQLIMMNTKQADTQFQRQLQNSTKLPTINATNCSTNHHHLITTADGELLEEGEFYLDDRLQTHKHNHNGHFLRHCQLLTKRSWLCLCKDPMLTTLRFSAHIIVPLLITLVYGGHVGKPNACPLYETDMDLIDYARRGAKRLLNLQDELRCTFENVGLYFLSIYAFTFSTMCLTSLSFPLNMHVLLKEVRNGWYSIPTYFIGKTLADFPLEFILPTVTLMITYPLTGQPSSYMEWRFLLATGIFVVTSLIAQTQGLIFGALFMNAMQAAVFVAPVSTTPLILLSGFLIRISQMPVYLQKLSSLSYFRYAIESLTIIRYGFNQCPCDPALVTGAPVSASGVPDQLRTMTNYWLSTFESEASANAVNETLSTAFNGTTDLGLTTTEQPPVDFFQDLTVLLARANSFGADIRNCEDLKPYPMIDFSLEDSQLWVWVAALVATLFISKIVNYLVVKYSVKFRL